MDLSWALLTYGVYTLAENKTYYSCWGKNNYPSPSLSEEVKCPATTTLKFLSMFRNSVVGKNFAKNCWQRLRNALNPANIGLEITESVFVSDHEEINLILRAEGCRRKFLWMILVPAYTGPERELNVHCLK